MIKPGEIQQKANAVGVRDQQVEKDYILSWILFGIAMHEQLSKAIVFKGGTFLNPLLRQAQDLYSEYHNLLLCIYSRKNSDIKNRVKPIWQLLAWFWKSRAEVQTSAFVFYVDAVYLPLVILRSGYWELVIGIEENMEDVLV